MFKLKILSQENKQTNLIRCIFFIVNLFCFQTLLKSEFDWVERHFISRTICWYYKIEKLKQKYLINSFSSLFEIDVAT